MIVFLAVVLLLTAWFLDWRIYHRQLDMIRTQHAAAIALRDKEVQSWRHQAKRWARLYDKEAVHSRDLRNDLVVERGYSAACDRQLRAIQQQVAGKCLWPTLGDDDVVVEMPTRRGGPERTRGRRFR